MRRPAARLPGRDLRPALSLIRARSYEDAVDLVNASPYGNGVAIFTNDGGAAKRFVSECQIGMAGVNMPIPVPATCI
jgi:malonate-semialdehyde dehydrogenase (acetylating)/methylmalonate-semialdehyde dehydrogenase